MLACSLAITAGSWLLTNAAAFADCAAPTSDAQLRDNADLIVTGTVEEVKVFSSSSRVEVRVDRVFKGEGGRTIFLKTNSGSRVVTSLDVEFEKSGHYLLYLRREGEEWTTDICSGTQELSGPVPPALTETLGEEVVPGAPEETTAPAASRSVPNTGGAPLTIVAYAGLAFASAGILLWRWALT